MNEVVTPRFAALSLLAYLPLSLGVFVLYFTPFTRTGGLHLLDALILCLPQAGAAALAYAIQKHHPVVGHVLVLRHMAFDALATVITILALRSLTGFQTNFFAVALLMYTSLVGAALFTMLATKVGFVLIEGKRQITELRGEIRQARWQIKLEQIRTRLHTQDALSELSQSVLSSLDEVVVAEPSLDDKQLRARVEHVLEKEVKPLSSDLRPIELKWGLKEALASLGLPIHGNTPNEVISADAQVQEEFYTIIRRLHAEGFIYSLDITADEISASGSFTSPEAEDIIRGTATPSLQITVQNDSSLRISLRRSPRWSNESGIVSAGHAVRVLVTSGPAFRTPIAALLSLFYVPTAFVPGAGSPATGILATVAGIGGALGMMAIFEIVDKPDKAPTWGQVSLVVARYALVGLVAGLTYEAASLSSGDEPIRRLAAAIALWLLTCSAIVVVSSLKVRSLRSTRLLQTSRDLTRERLSYAQKQAREQADALDGLWHGRLQGKLAAIAVMLDLGKSDDARRELQRLARVDIPDAIADLRRTLKSVQESENDSLLSLARTLPLGLYENLQPGLLAQIPPEAADSLKQLVASAAEMAYQHGGAQNLSVEMRLSNNRLIVECTADAAALARHGEDSDGRKLVSAFCSRYGGDWVYTLGSRGITVGVNLPFPLRQVTHAQEPPLMSTLDEAAQEPLSAFRAAAIMLLLLPVVRWVGFGQAADDNSFLEDIVPNAAVLISNIGSSAAAILVAYFLQKFVPLRGWALSLRQGLLAVIPAQTLVVTLNAVQGDFLNNGFQLIIYYTFFITVALGTRFAELVLERRSRGLHIQAAYERQVVLSSRYAELMDEVSAARRLGNRRTLNAIVVQALRKLLDDREHSATWMATQVEELQNQVVRPMSHSLHYGVTETAIAKALTALSPSVSVRTTPGVGTSNADPYLWVTVELFRVLIRAVEENPSCAIEFDDQREQVLITLGRRAPFTLTHSESRHVNVDVVDGGDVLVFKPIIGEIASNRPRTFQDVIVLLTTGPALRPNTALLLGLVMWPMAAFFYTTVFARGLGAGLAGWVAAVVIAYITAPWVTKSIAPTVFNALRVLFMYAAIGLLSGQVFSWVRVALKGPDDNLDLVLGSMFITVCFLAIHIVSTLGVRNERTLNELRRVSRQFQDERREQASAVNAEDESLAVFLHQTVQGRMTVALLMLRNGEVDQAKALLTHLVNEEIPQQLQAGSHEVREIPSLINVPVPLRVTQHINREVFGSLSTETLDGLYRIVGEAAVNSFRHGGAQSLDITLVRRGSNIHLICKDDGRGLSDGFDPNGLGLSSVGTFTDARDGFWRIFSDDTGTTLHLQFPADVLQEEPITV